MKGIPALILLLLATPCLTGCFTTASRMNQGMSAGSTGANLAPAVALDVITLPIQAPFLAKFAIDQSNGRATQRKLMEKREEQLAELRKDPEVLFQHSPRVENWVVRAAIEDRTIPFTADQLRRLAGTNDWTRPFVLADPRCPKDLLDEAWLGLSRLPDHARNREVNSLASNPNIPDAWLEEMVQRPDIYRHASFRAKEILGKRKREAGGSADKPPPPAAPPLKR